MKYIDGKSSQLGDCILIGGQYQGRVVADIDRSEYSNHCSKEQWAYLKSGILVDTDFGGLVHYKQDDLFSETIELISRA